MAEKIKRVFELGGVLDGSVKRIFSFTDKKLSKVGDQLKALKQRQKALNKELKGFKDVGDPAYRSTLASITKVGAAIDEAKSKQDRLNKSLKLQAKIGQQLGKAASNAKRVGLGLGAGLTAAAVSTQAGATRLEEQRQWAERLGTTAAQLSRLVFVGDRYGVTQDAMVDGLKELQIRSDEFIKTGVGGGAESFERLGLSADDLASAGGDVNKLFDLVQARLRHVKDAAARQRLVDELFGGSAGEQLAELVSMSSEEMQALKAEADALGVTLTADNAARVKSYMEEWRKTKSVFSSLHTNMSVSLMAPLGEALKRVSGYITENKDTINQFGQTLARVVGDALPLIMGVGGALFGVMMTVGNGIGTIAEFFGGFDKLAIIIGGIYGLSKAFTILRTAMLLGMGPIGWVLGALTALATGLTAFWAWVSGEEPEKIDGPENSATALPDVTTAREPVQINITQQPGEDSEAFAQRVVDVMEMKRAEQSSGALFDAGQFAHG